MSKYRKLSHTVYYCTYHIVWTPKYRFKIIEGKLAEFIEEKIRQISRLYSVDIEELKVMKDHVHIVCSIPPKLSVSSYVVIIKGKTAIKVFQKKRYLKEKPYWGNHFWSRGYFVSTLGLDEEKVKRYVKDQEEQEKQIEKDSENYNLFER
jgi:REP-associated tyrosine transposase